MFLYNCLDDTIKYTIPITINNVVDDTDMSGDFTLTIIEDSSNNKGTINVSDYDGITLDAFSISVQPTYGSVTLSGGMILFIIKVFK